jgi:hypothetical protein
VSRCAVEFARRLATVTVGRRRGGKLPQQCLQPVEPSVDAAHLQRHVGDCAPESLDRQPLRVTLGLRGGVFLARRRALVEDLLRRRHRLVNQLVSARTRVGQPQGDVLRGGIGRQRWCDKACLIRSGRAVLHWVLRDVGAPGQARAGRVIGDRRQHVGQCP